jgi:hypothetical protein
LRNFSDSTRLKVNYNKSFLVPISIDEDRALHLAQFVGCQVGAISFAYLGLPLGTARPSVEEFLPLLQRIEGRMMGLSKLLIYQGRLTLVNSVLSELPTFYMCDLKIPVSIFE